LVVRELLTGDLSGSVGGLGGGVVDGDDSPCGVDPLRQIAVIHFGGGDGAGGSGGAGAVAEGFVGDEEERLVFVVVELRDEDGSADGGAVVVLLADGDADAAGVVEGVVGIEFLVAEELVGGAVEAVGAGLGDEVHGASAGGAVLGFEAVGIDGELSDGVDGGGPGGDPPLLEGAGGVGGDAIESGSVTGGLAAAEVFGFGVRAARSKGLRRVPPMTRGSSTTILLLMVTEVFAFSAEQKE